MSEKIYGSYRVDSARELRRWRLEAARERFARVAAGVGSLHAEIQAATATYGELSVGVPAGMPPSSNDPDRWDEGADWLERELAQSRTDLDQALSAARVRRFAASARSVSASVAPDEPQVRKPIRSSENGVTERYSVEQEITRVLARLPRDSVAEKVDQCLKTANRCQQATNKSQSDKLLLSLRLLVQRETDRATLVAANQLRVESWHAELDGLVGHNIEMVRGLLKGLPLEQPLPKDLGQQVKAARDAAVAERDRLFVLTAAAVAFAELGYAVGDDFVTAVPSRSGALIDLPHSSRHGVTVRENHRQLELIVVRYDESGARDSVADIQAETLFCADFSRLRSQLSDQGVELDLVRTDPPGTTSLQLVHRTGRREDQRRTPSPRVRRRSP